jgi:hypothetical protein
MIWVQILSAFVRKSQVFKNVFLQKAFEKINEGNNISTPYLGTYARSEFFLSPSKVQFDSRTTDSIQLIVTQLIVTQLIATQLIAVSK